MAPAAQGWQWIEMMFHLARGRSMLVARSDRPRERCSVRATRQGSRWAKGKGNGWFSLRGPTRPDLGGARHPVADRRPPSVGRGGGRQRPDMGFQVPSLTSRNRSSHRDKGGPLRTGAPSDPGGGICRRVRGQRRDHEGDRPAADWKGVVFDLRRLSAAEARALIAAVDAEPRIDPELIRFFPKREDLQSINGGGAHGN